MKFKFKPVITLDKGDDRQFLSRDYSVTYGLEKNFKINCITKLMLPINSVYQRGDHWGSVLSLNFLSSHEV